MEITVHLDTGLGGLVEKLAEKRSISSSALVTDFIRTMVGRICLDCAGIGEDENGKECASCGGCGRNLRVDSP